MLSLQQLRRGAKWQYLAATKDAERPWMKFIIDVSNGKAEFE